MDNQLTEKLILLYLIREKDNITPTELSDFIIFRGYMDYFDLGSYLNELIGSGMVLELKRDGNAYYTLHPSGVEAVEMFRARIPHSIREEIRDYAQNSFLHSSTLLEAEILTEPCEKSIQLTGRILDFDSPVMEVHFEAKTEEEAAVIRDNWYKKGLSIYYNVLRDIGGRNAKDTENGGNDADTGTPGNL